MNDSINHNKVIVQRLFAEVWDAGDYAVLDQLIDADCVLHDPNPNLNGARGPQGHRQWLELSRTAFPEIRHELEQYAEADRVVTFYKGHTVHQGEIAGIAPTGKSLTIEGYLISQLKDGKIIDQRGRVDVMGLMQQLGGVPTQRQNS